MRPIPGDFAYLWDWFEEIKNFTGHREPLLPSELSQWAGLKALSIEPFEATTLLHMDVVYRSNLPTPRTK